MKLRSLLLSFLAVLVMLFVMGWQGRLLESPVSPMGILALEFARTPERLAQLRLFMNGAHVTWNIILDFLFIAAYTWFLVSACQYLRTRIRWEKWSTRFISIAVAAGLFDVFENFLMLLIWNGRFSPQVLQVVFYCAMIKFILVAAVLLFILGSLPFALISKK